MIADIGFQRAVAAGKHFPCVRFVAGKGADQDLTLDPAQFIVGRIKFAQQEVGQLDQTEMARQQRGFSGNHMRGHAHAGAAAFRNEIGRLETMEQGQLLAGKVIKSNPGI